MNLNEFITVRHPETGGVAQVTRRGMEDVWEERGWVSVEDEDPDDLEKASKVRLQEIAGEMGVDVSAAKTKAEMVKLIKEGPPSVHD